MSDVNRRRAGEDALRAATPKVWPAPQRSEMLAQAYLRASLTMENRMNVIERMFAGRPLVTRFGIAALLLLALGATVVLLPRPNALAATEGVVLSYDLSNFDQEQARNKFKEIEQALTANLPAGVQLLTADVKAEVRREKRMVKHDGVEHGSPQETETRKVSGILVLSAADDAVVAKLRDAVARAVPGIAEPQVQDATWFRKQGGGLDGGIFIGLNMNGEDHSFNFPEGTSAEQMESEINAWLAQTHPGEKFDVDVEVNENRSGENVRKEIKVKIAGDEEKHGED